MIRPQTDDPNTPTSLEDIAIRLLELQQRLTAFDSLYNEEISGLSTELTRLKADFLRHYKALPPSESEAAKTQRSSRGAGRSKMPRKMPKQQSDRSSAQKE